MLRYGGGVPKAVVPALHDQHGGAAQFWREQHGWGLALTHQRRCAPDRVSRLYRDGACAGQVYYVAKSPRSPWLSRAAPWKVTLHGGQGWQCEGPDLIGVEPWPHRLLPCVHAANKGPTYAIASSYSWGEVMQVGSETFANLFHVYTPLCLVMELPQGVFGVPGCGPAGAAAGEGHERRGGCCVPGQQP